MPSQFAMPSLTVAWLQLTTMEILLSWLHCCQLANVNTRLICDITDYSLALTGHQLLLLQLPTATHYRASGRTEYKTLFPAVPPMLRVYFLFRELIYRVVTKQWLSSSACLNILLKTCELEKSKSGLLLSQIR
jgi:hypothetical protein